MIFRGTVAHAKFTIVLGGVLLALLTIGQVYADASPPGVSPNQDSTGEPPAINVPATPQMDATEMTTGAMDHMDHQTGSDHADHGSAPEANVPDRQTDARA